MLTNTFAEAFKDGASWARKLPLMRLDTPENVETSEKRVELRRPAGVLQLIELSDVQLDARQLEPPMEDFNEIKCDPKCWPTKDNTAAPVEEKFLGDNVVSATGCSSDKTGAETLFTKEAREITKFLMLRIDGKTLIEMLEWQTQAVVSIEDILKVALASNRARKLASHLPNPAPDTVTLEDDVIAEIDARRRETTNCANKEVPVFATALLCTVNSTLRRAPTEADRVHVTAVSLCQ